MDSVRINHSSSFYLLFLDLKHVFYLAGNKLFFLDDLIYDENHVIYLNGKKKDFKFFDMNREKSDMSSNRSMETEEVFQSFYYKSGQKILNFIGSMIH